MSTPTTFQRRPLTQEVLTALRTVQVGPTGNTKDALAGEGTMPLGSGWGTGEANAPGSVFVPYFVLTPSQATPWRQTDSLRAAGENWVCPYVVQAFGVKQNQAEWMADRGRVAVQALRHAIYQCGESKYKVERVELAQIGAVTRVPYSEPPFYGQSDVVTLYMTKRKS